MIDTNHNKYFIVNVDLNVETRFLIIGDKYQYYISRISKL